MQLLSQPQMLVQGQILGLQGIHGRIPLVRIAVQGKAVRTGDKVDGGHGAGLISHGQDRVGDSPTGGAPHGKTPPTSQTMLIHLRGPDGPTGDCGCRPSGDGTSRRTSPPTRERRSC